MKQSPARDGLPLVCSAIVCVFLLVAGCHDALVQWTDRDVAEMIRQRQRSNLRETSDTELREQGRAEPRTPRSAYQHDPGPTIPEVPEEFEPEAPASQPTTSTAPASQPDDVSPEDYEAAVSTLIGQPRKFRDEVFDLTNALAYAQRHRRQLQTAKEDLYLAALRLTLERHLWTPQFAAELRAVYGNYGEDQDFDQAMRFVADLSVSQRLPYGGRFTAGAISTLVRDINQGVTASEGGVSVLGLEVPLLRGAGHVAREDLIQLERALTYAVRDFEVFRRDQLVLVAQGYFDLLQSKQDVLDSFRSVEVAIDDYERARAMEEADQAIVLDTGRAEQRLVSEANRAAQLQEAFRFGTDQFKLLIGMPVDELMGLDDLEDIETIERKIDSGEYVLLRPPPAANDEVLSLEVAIRSRLELMNRRDQVDDAKRGVEIARNNLLPDLNWNSSVTFDTDPNHYRVTDYSFDRANWRSEMILAMNDRFAERNQYRASIIDVRRAQRALTDNEELVRVEVRRAVNQIALQERVLRIQEQNLRVANLRGEYARIQFEEGLILDNRDVIEAEDEVVTAQSALSAAKTTRWAAILQFRLATGTLRVDESGMQYDSGP
jgi:outer membrane protein TolC